jgi:hypothetical protein
MRFKSSDEWEWEIVHSNRQENLVLQKATGYKDKEGWIGIPDIELCTLTVLKEGLVSIRDWDTKKDLGVMGPNFRFHYSVIMEGYNGRKDYYGNPLPSNEEILKTASKTHVRLKTVSEKSIFYCVSDPLDKMIWDGYSNILNNKPEIFKMSKNTSYYRFISLDDNININGREIKKYRPVSLDVYDKDITFTGKGMYLITAPLGIYKKSDNLNKPRYVLNDN